MANAINQDITNKVVVLKEEVMTPEYRGIADRLFLAEGGFGCQPSTIGGAVFGKHLSDGERARYDGWHFERLATEEDLKAVPNWNADQTPTA